MSQSRLLVALTVCFVWTAAAAIFAQEQQGTSTHPQRTITAHPSDNNPAKGLDETDKKFLKDAAIGDQAEIGLGQMAQEKASNPDVKSFGQRMLKDHSKADDQLKNIAATKNVSLPTQLDQTHESAKERLSKLSGSKFDEAYMLLMTQEHTKDVRKFQHEAAAAHDPTVRDFAKNSVPLLKSHLKEANEIKGKLKEE